MLSEKTKLNTNEVLVCKALIESYINDDEFFSMNNVLRNYIKVKREIENLKDFNLFIKECHVIVWSIEEKESINQKL